MRLSLLVFDGLTSLDAVGGYEVLARVPGVELEFVAREPGIIAADTRRLGLLAWRGLEEVAETDILYVPGGPGARALERDPAMLDWLRRVDASSRWTVGICNGVTLLAAAGLLRGRPVATNYFDQARVAAYGAQYRPVRYQRSGKYLTGAGVSASIDTALYLARELAGPEVAAALQLGIEYFPAPPFGPATPAETTAATQAMVRAYDDGPGQSLLTQPPAFAGWDAR